MNAILSRATKARGVAVLHGSRVAAELREIIKKAQAVMNQVRHRDAHDLSELTTMSENAVYSCVRTAFPSDAYIVRTNVMTIPVENVEKHIPACGMVAIGVALTASTHGFWFNTYTFVVWANVHSGITWKKDPVPDPVLTALKARDQRCISSYRPFVAFK